PRQFGAAYLLAFVVRFGWGGVHGDRAQASCWRAQLACPFIGKEPTAGGCLARPPVPGLVGDLLRRGDTCFFTEVLGKALSEHFFQRPPPSRKRLQRRALRKALLSQPLQH